MGLEMTASDTDLSMEKPHLLSIKLLCYAILPIVIFRIVFLYMSSSPFPHAEHLITGSIPVSIPSSYETSLLTPANSSNGTVPLVTQPPTSFHESSMITPKVAEDVKKLNEPSSSCDYSNGKWIRSELGPMYNDTSCTIRDGQNCISHGRPDTGYLYWRWKPSGHHCDLPRFDPETFLTLMRNKHLAFAGDSLARNQMESLTCLLSSSYPPSLVHSHTDGQHGRWAKWNFPSHNVSVSIYWSPFLVKGTVRSPRKNYNRMYMDIVDETWASDLGLIDVLVLSIGHWFLWSSVYFEGGMEVGCRYCHDKAGNRAEVDIRGVFAKAFSTTFKAIMDQRKATATRNGIDVIVTTYSPDHFEGEWNKGGSCPKTEPYGESMEVEDMYGQIRNVEVEAVEEAKRAALEMEHGGEVRFTTLDVTKLAWLRPDAHPGPYMHRFPFANQTNQVTLVQQDCVHWCLPGAIDVWNEIMLEIIKGWSLSS